MENTWLDSTARELPEVMLDSLAGIDLVDLLLIWLATACATILRSFTGFGFALAAVPVYAFFLPPTEAVALCASLSVVLGLQTLPQYASEADFKPQWPIFALALPGTLLGAWLLQTFAIDEFRLAIGLLTIAASLVLASYHPRHRRAGPAAKTGAGLVSGVINGAFAIPGPPIIIYCMATEADPARSRAFMIGFFTFSSIVALSTYSVSGLVTWHVLVLALLTYPSMFLGDRLGYALFKKHGSNLHRRIAIAVCLLIGVSITLRALL